MQTTLYAYGGQCSMADFSKIPPNIILLDGKVGTLLKASCSGSWTTNVKHICTYRYCAKSARCLCSSSIHLNHLHNIDQPSSWINLCEWLVPDPKPRNIQSYENWSLHSACCIEWDERLHLQLVHLYLQLQKFHSILPYTGCQKTPLHIP